MVVLAASAAERADENVGAEHARHLLATSSLDLGARHSALNAVTMRDALAEAARLREENLKILQVMQWGATTIEQDNNIRRGHEVQVTI